MATWIPYADTWDKMVRETVIYQNPLLFLKIWEIREENAAPGGLDPGTWHFHQEVEFLAVAEGCLGVQTRHDYTLLQPGDVMVMGASQPHRSHKPCDGPLRYVVFQVDLSKYFDQSTIRYLHVFSELTRPLNELNYMFAQSEDVRREIHAWIMEIFRESQAQSNGYELAVSAAIKRLVLALLRNDTRHVLDQTDETDFDRIKPVLGYIDANLSGKVDVTGASERLHLSYHYFLKYFKKVMGASFTEYVNFKRIKKSELLLLTSDRSISEIGYEIGIPNMAHFYKLFKRYNHCSPGEFRIKLKSV